MARTEDEEHFVKVLKQKYEVKKTRDEHAHQVYRDKNYLTQEYLIKKKSCEQISKECNVSAFTITNWLKKTHIQLRSRSEANLFARSNHFKITKEAKEFLIGELLGDGCLNGHKFSAQFERASKFENYLEWLSQELKKFGIIQAGRIHNATSSFCKRNVVSFYYASIRYIELKDLHDKWYRKARQDERSRSGRLRKWIKIVPPSLEITPLVCRQWYIGDGSLDKRFGHIMMCTDGFSCDEVNFLIKKVRKLGFPATYQRCNNEIRLPRKCVKDFLDYIGPSPISCYNYKWKAKC